MMPISGQIRSGNIFMGNSSILQIPMRRTNVKKTNYVLILLVMSLTACASPRTPPLVTEPVSAPGENNTPVPGTAVTETIAQGKMPAPSFESQTYLNEAVGFALDYPAQWTVKETIIGDRGTETLLLSTPEVADLETLPPGATRVAIHVNQWDPKSDLTAFAGSRKTAWDASGFTILEEEPLTLDLGLAAMRYTVETPAGLAVEFLFAAIKDQYVTISGEGDLALVREIMQYLRPIGN
jgi:hypothetical protein